MENTFGTAGTVVVSIEVANNTEENIKKAVVSCDRSTDKTSKTLYSCPNGLRENCSFGNASARPEGAEGELTSSHSDT